MEVTTISHKRVCWPQGNNTSGSWEIVMNNNKTSVGVMTDGPKSVAQNKYKLNQNLASWINLWLYRHYRHNKYHMDDHCSFATIQIAPLLPASQHYISLQDQHIHHQTCILCTAQFHDHCWFATPLIALSYYGYIALPTSHYLDWHWKKSRQIIWLKESWPGLLNLPLGLYQHQCNPQRYTGGWMLLWYEIWWGGLTNNSY